MGIAGDSKRGQGNVASEAADERRAKEGFADALERASTGKGLSPDQLAARRNMIAEIAATLPKHERPAPRPRTITAQDFKDTNGVEPLDAIFTRDDGWSR